MVRTKKVQVAIPNTLQEFYALVRAGKVITLRLGNQSSSAPLLICNHPREFIRFAKRLEQAIEETKNGRQGVPG